MIAVPWFRFPWTTATADFAHAVVVAARDGNPEARGQLDEIKAQAAKGHKTAVKAQRHFAAITKLVEAGQPPPSVILQMRPVQIGTNGGFPGAIPTLPWGYQSIWNYGFDPFVFEEMGWGDVDVGQLPAGFTPMYNPPTWPRAVGEPLPGEIEYEYETRVGQFPLGAPGGVPLLPFGFGPFNYGYGGPSDGYFRSGPGMSEDIELEDRYIG